MGPLPKWSVHFYSGQRHNFHNSSGNQFRAKSGRKGNGAKPAMINLTTGNCGQFTGPFSSPRRRFRLLVPRCAFPRSVIIDGDSERAKPVFRHSLGTLFVLFCAALYMRLYRSRLPRAQSWNSRAARAFLLPECVPPS